MFATASYYFSLCPDNYSFFVIVRAGISIVFSNSIIHSKSSSREIMRPLIFIACETAFDTVNTIVHGYGDDKDSSIKDHYEV